MAASNPQLAYSLKPLVSVITPAYNADRFIGKAVDSVLAQILENWELIVVNDGSTDGTAQVLASFGDRRIRVLHQENGGEAAARNRGLDEACGKYLAFLDSDDLFLPNALDDLAAFLEAHPETDIAFSDGFICDEHETRLGRLSDIRPGKFTGNILEPLVLDPTVIAFPVCIMARRSCVEASCIRFDPALVIGTDWDFFIQLAPRAWFGYLDRPTCMYRIHQTNITKTAGAERRRSDLVKGRLKVLRAEWFQELSLVTRRRFFYNLLIDLLGNEPEQQGAMLQAPQFLALPANIQAELLRLVASDHLLKHQETEFALRCLRTSLALQPQNRKSKLLLKSAEQSPLLAARILDVWRLVHDGRMRLRSLGRRSPQPAPTALVPASR